ncbi:hypothetical protein F2I39_24625 [Escherichia coli]|nr:hypothetical protein [Escherichia coli]
MSINIDGRDCCQTGQPSQDVTDGALTCRGFRGGKLRNNNVNVLFFSFTFCKRKLTAVCSHQTRIGNLDAHLI